MRNPDIASRLLNAPLMVLPDKLDAVIYGLQERIGVVVTNAPEPSAYLTDHGEHQEPGYFVLEGVATIEVIGGLAHRGGFQADSSYILGYQTLAKRFKTAMNDRDVHTILFVFDSPGGEVAGVFALANQIYNARGQKRIVASVSDMACSAGYLLASACGEIYASETACTGSIGVVMSHIDQSKRVEKMGMKITHIYAGDHKVDGNSFEALSDEVRARFNAVCGKLYSLFTQRVSLYTGLDVQAVIATQAQVYIGDESLSMGLIDGIETSDETISRLISEKGGAGSRRTTIGMETSTMSVKKEGPAAGTETPTAKAASEPGTETAAVEQVEPVAATAEPAKVSAASPVVEPVSAQAAERARIQKIMSCEHATANMDQANHLAYETAMSAEDAIGILAKGAGAVKPAANKLDEVMAATTQPNVGADSGSGSVEMSDSESILSNLNAARGNVKGVKA